MLTSESFLMYVLWLRRRRRVCITGDPIL